MKYTGLMILPLAVEILPNLGSEAFRRNVFGFGALEYVQKPFTLGFFGGINLLAAAAAFVLVWAYQKKAETEGETYSWAIFFCVAISFAIFGFSTWNPQWILLMAPFLVLNIMISGNGNLLLMVTNIFMLAMYIFCSQSMVDERVLNGGILKYVLKDREFAVRMWEFLQFHDQGNALYCNVGSASYLCGLWPSKVSQPQGRICGKGTDMADPFCISFWRSGICDPHVDLCGRSSFWKGEFL